MKMFLDPCIRIGTVQIPKPLQISTQNWVYLILHQFDKLPNAVEMGPNIVIILRFFVGSLDANFNKNRVNVQEFAQNKGLTLFRAGSERFDYGRGTFSTPPLGSKKTHIGATNGKKHLIGRW